MADDVSTAEGLDHPNGEAPEGAANEKDERGVPWKNRAAEFHRKMDAAEARAAEMEAKYAEIEAALKGHPQSAAILSALISGSPLPIAEAKAEVDEDGKIVKDPLTALKETAAELRRVKAVVEEQGRALAGIGGMTQQQAEAQAAQSFTANVASAMATLGVDPANERLRVRISDAVLSECARRNDARNPVRGPDELARVVQGVVEDLSISKGTTRTRSLPPPSTTRAGGAPARGEKAPDISTPAKSQELLLRLLEEAGGA